MKVIVHSQGRTEPYVIEDVKKVSESGGMLVIKFGSTIRKYPLANIWAYDVVA